MSPMIAGLRTFEATANPVKNREKMKRCVVGLIAASMVPRMKTMLATMKTGYRPYISESGAISRGPAASPSSQTVTSKMLADLLSFPSRSSTIRSATGTTPMQVKDLSISMTGGTLSHGRSSHCESHGGKQENNAMLVRLWPIQWIFQIAIGVEIQ